MSHDGDALDVLVVTGGHPFEPEPFFAVFDDLAAEHGWRITRATEPAVGYDVIVGYDMPGLVFTRDPERPVELPEPSPERVDTYRRITEQGAGWVLLHHAVASWPSWPGFAELVGGRFHYQPGELRGTHYPDSGYRFDVTHTVEVLRSDHPVCAGLGDSFTLTDELYCFPVLTDDVVPLMRTTFDTADSSAFFSADQAIRGRRNSNEGWSHPPGSDLVAWAKSAGRSPLVYLQFGDGPVTYADASFRRALANSIAWVATDAAREWATRRSDGRSAFGEPPDAGDRAHH